MKKAIKKITALGLAAVTAASLGLTALADDYENKTWSVAHVNTPGSPSILNYTYVYMNASSDTYAAAATKMTETLASREVKITSDNHTMRSSPIVFNTVNNAKEWTIVLASLDTVSYKVTATTLDTGTLNAEGYIRRYYKK